MICYVDFRGDNILLRLLTAGFLLVIQDGDGKPPYEVVWYLLNQVMMQDDFCTWNSVASLTLWLLKIPSLCLAGPGCILIGSLWSYVHQLSDFEGPLAPLLLGPGLCLPFFSGTFWPGVLSTVPESFAWMELYGIGKPSHEMFVFVSQGNLGNVSIIIPASFFVDLVNPIINHSPSSLTSFQAPLRVLNSIKWVYHIRIKMKQKNENTK